jgi:hypothetical protein
MKALKQNLLTAALLVTTALTGLTAEPVSAAGNLFFKMQPSQGALTCLPYAFGSVTVSSLGPIENMHVVVRNLPPNTNFDFFVIQTPEAPFGLSWYQGDIETDANGVGVADFVGRFNVETFIVAPGSDVAPSVHKTGAFPDAATNPATAPVHTFHLGLWFNSPTDAAKAGCNPAVTPFNGDHHAGIQVLNTAQFAKNWGPLARLKP